MLEIALKVINKITEHGYKAYIVGGFVRDYILDIDSNDIDVTTNATPKQIKEIFEETSFPDDDYGSITVIYKGIRFEITTFRKEIIYKDHRRPVKIKYIDDLYEDLTRRDFTINTLCMDGNGEIIDFLKGKDDIEGKIIKTVGNSDDKFNEDALRILRAVRFSTNLGFNLSDEVRDAIINNKQYLREISYNRKKEELDKIFSSSNSLEGIKLLLELGLDKPLELDNLDKVKESDSLIGKWAILDVLDIYPFTKNEKDLIEKIKKVYELNELDSMTLYRYGLYVCSVVGTMKGTSKTKITENYNKLPIHDRNDLDINSEEIMECLNKGPGEYLREIYEKIEDEVLRLRMPNKKEEIISYIEKKYI